MYYDSKPKTGVERRKFGFFLFICTVLITFTDFSVNVLKTNILYDMNWLSWLYYIPAALGHASLYALVLYLVAYLPFSFIFRNGKVATTVYCIAAVLLQVLIVLDGFVFDLYRFHINGFVLELAFGGGSDIFVFDFGVCLKFTLFILLVAVLPYIVALYLSRKFYQRLNRKNITSICVLLAFCLLTAHIGHAFAAASRQASIQKSATAMPLFFPLTANSLLEKLGLFNRDEIDDIDYNRASADLQYPIHSIESTDSIPDYNIMYIGIDSWNPSTFDSINTPNIYKLSQRGQYFDNHYSSSNGTRGSLFGLFFGVSYTYEKEFIMTKKSPLFIDQLMSRMYDIQVFPSACFTSPPFNETIFRRVSDINVKTKGATVFERDNKIADMTIDYVNERKSDKPFFSFTFFDLPHAISIPKEYRKKFQPSWDEADYMALSNEMDRTPYFNLYKNCVYHVDHLIGKILDDIEAKGMMERTVIIVTGDHGQEFNENKKNYWGHSGNYSKWQTNVPLIVYYPGIDAGKRFSHMTTHYDISPSVMKHFLGVTNPYDDFSMGYDLYDKHTRYPHLVGDHVNYGFVFDNMIITTNHLGAMDVTDKDLNELPRNSVNIDDLKAAIEKKNMFYKK